MLNNYSENCVAVPQLYCHHHQHHHYHVAGAPVSSFTYQLTVISFLVIWLPGHTGSPVLSLHCDVMVLCSSALVSLGPIRWSCLLNNTLHIYVRSSWPFIPYYLVHKEPWCLCVCAEYPHILWRSRQTKKRLQAHLAKHKSCIQTLHRNEGNVSNQSFESMLSENCLSADQHSQTTALSTMKLLVAEI